MSSKKAAKKPARTKRKNKPGAGRPAMGRTKVLPRIRPEAASLFREMQTFLPGPNDRPPTLAEVIEIAARVAMDAMEGRPILKIYLRYGA